MCTEITVDCGTGYYNDGEDNCVACGTNCAECSNITGACTTCEDTYTVSSSDP